jgi:hypothetical protein
MFRFAHRCFTHRLRLLLAFLFLFCSAKTWAADPPSAKSVPKYSRFTLPTAGHDAKFETAVRSFRAASDPAVQVDLVGVIHIGEQAYYEQIDKLLDDYDVVLYECVAHTKGGKPGKTGYGKLAKALGLEPQGKHINYDRGHFVHADMTVAELREAFRKRGLPYTEPDDEAGAKVLGWLGPVNARWAVTLIMAYADRKAQPSDPVVIGDRNQVALEVLATTLAKGHKKIAIFYGANHMPDFERELTGRFNMVGGELRWLTAWTLPVPKINVAPQPAPKLRAAASVGALASFPQTTSHDSTRMMEHVAVEMGRGVLPRWLTTGR